MQTKKRKNKCLLHYTLLRRRRKKFFFLVLKPNTMQSEPERGSFTGNVFLAMIQVCFSYAAAATNGQKNVMEKVAVREGENTPKDRRKACQWQLFSWRSHFFREENVLWILFRTKACWLKNLVIGIFAKLCDKCCKLLGESSSKLGLVKCFNHFLGSPYRCKFCKANCNY